ncbi:MAG: TIGR03960 family B12-binding radical SAM protein, partial [Calditrichota bacterium]
RVDLMMLRLPESGHGDPPHYLQNLSLLKGVQSPARYLGGERGAVRPNQKGDFRICLIFPDLYEIGISYHGFQILYGLFNHIAGVVCERSYLPWPDMQDLMKSRKMSLCSVESGQPVRSFDAVGITLQTEMHYPGIVKILDLAGLPRRAADRSKLDPMVIGGGPNAFQAEPVALFFDAILLGDGEEAAAELANLMRCGEFQRSDRIERWHQLSGIPGVYAPWLYWANPGEPRRIVPLNDASPSVRARTEIKLKPDYYPRQPIVPLLPAAHDRLVVEIMRGCTQGCRFCQAGMINRPVRERPVADIVEQVMTGLELTGWNEVGLLSLSTSDYSRLEELLTILADELSPRRATLAFPSLRPASFTEEIAAIDTGGRRSSLTFAVEAGSQRLRDVINKSLTEDELLEAVARAWQHGWKGIKLYFMVGLPGETEEDVSEGARIIHKISRMRPSGGRLNVSVAPFIPKPHSIFEGAPFLDPETLLRRQLKLLGGIRARWFKGSWREVEPSRIEAILARGDRRLAPVIEAVADQSYGFESWDRMFSGETWQRALGEWRPDWSNLLNEIPPAAARPWDHLRKGISNKFADHDRMAAQREERLPDCRSGECPKCGLMVLCDQVEALSPPDLDTMGGRDQTHQEPPVGLTSDHQRYRFYFSKLGRIRFLGHQDLMRAVIRALLTAQVPLSWREGFSPHPKVGFGPAIPLGYGAARLWVEFETTRSWDESAAIQTLHRVCPRGIKPVKIEEAPIKVKSPEENEDLVIPYRVRFTVEQKLKPVSEVFNTNGVQAKVQEVKLDRFNRTLRFTLIRLEGRVPRAEEIASWLVGNSSENRDANIASVTRLSV